MSEPHSLFEVTCRCIQQRFLLRPSKRLNTLVLGVLGMAMQNLPAVRVYIFAFASNHFHMILSSPNHRTLSEFMCFVNTNLAKEAGRLHNWSGPFWADRFHATEVRGPRAMLQRLAYVLAHGVKENLVAECGHWPGVNCTESLLFGKPLRGIWVDRTSLYNANRNSENASERDFERLVDIHLTRLPCLAELSEEEHREKIRSIVEEIQQLAARKRQDRGKKIMGASRVCKQNPHARPEKVTRSPAPKCHASNKELWRKHVESYQQFEQQYRRAISFWTAGSHHPNFPLGCFLPGGIFLDGKTGPPRNGSAI